MKVKGNKESTKTASTTKFTECMGPGFRGERGGECASRFLPHSVKGYRFLRSKLTSSSLSYANNKLPSRFLPKVRTD